MNVSAIQALRRRLAAGEPAYGFWVTLESPAVVEIAVALGVDWVVIDAEHGQLDWQEIVGHLRAAVRSRTVTLVRIAALDAALVKRALDLGADGVVVPWMETAEQVRQAVSFARYPPQGQRGIGGERATGWGQAVAEHVADANEHVLVVPLIETRQGAAQAHELAAVDGVELFMFGPSDLSSSFGHRGQWEGPGVAEEILRVKDVIRAAGKHAGIMARGSEDMARRIAQGFGLVALASDVGLVAGGLKGALEAAGRRPSIRADLAAGG